MNKIFIDSYKGTKPGQSENTTKCKDACVWYDFLI